MLVKSHVKYIQSLSQKKVRDEDAAFVAEGPKIIKELLNTKNVALIQLYALKTWIEENKESMDGLSEKLIEINNSEMERLSFLQSPNQVLGIFKKPAFRKSEFYGKITLMLDGIQDPGNLGTIVRTADWFGIETVICSKDSADVFNPKVVQSTMGSIARVHAMYEDLKTIIEKYSSIPVYAAALDGNKLFDMDGIEEGFILIGNESKGIHENLLELANQKITIPGTGYAESLNAAVAVGIVLAYLKKP
jgi:TrmH family RNA methyltransferase